MLAMGSWACTSNYLPLFYKVIHPYMILSEEEQLPRGLVRLPPIIVQPQLVQPLVNYVQGGDSLGR